MLEINGLEVLARVQKLGQAFPSAKKTKVVMVTSQGERESVKQSILIGAAGYILKPYQKDRICDEIRRLMGPEEEDHGAVEEDGPQRAA